MLEPNEHEALKQYLNQKKQKAQSPQGLYDIETASKAAVDRPTVGEDDFFQGRPTNNIFLETSIEQEARVRQNSPFGHLKTWRLIRVIVKSNDDVRQEQFAMQLIS